MSIVFESVFEYGLIYVLSINDKEHDGLLKIGYTTLKTDKSIDNLQPGSNILKEAANKRIYEYTKTAAIPYRLEHVELAIKQEFKDGKYEISQFKDHDVHRVLINSGVRRKEFSYSKGKEWFNIDIDVVKKAINAVKEGRLNLSGTKSEKEFSPIILRPEQKEAVEKTVNHFKKNKTMLWNAKMRFGKTVAALFLIKEMGFEKSIIVTHRPVVNAGWRDDFDNIFCATDDCVYLSKKDASSDVVIPKKGKFVYFASIQDLRGSSYVDGKFDKNSDVFKTEWDLVIVDEAHEGTTTALGNDVIEALVKEKTCPKTKFLALSGTPFNIADLYDENSTYTWDYTMEQKAKQSWASEHFGDVNPYIDLPKLNIYTYDLGKLIKSSIYVELLDKAFNFSEFFRVKLKGAINDSVAPQIGDPVEFVHKEDVNNFLDLITRPSKDSMYPFSTEEQRKLFKHTLWMVPGVKEAKALEELLKEHSVFSSTFFKIINVAGNEENKDPLKAVKDAILEAGDDGYTITLSCGKLTTGVTIKEWSGVFMLSGSYETSAANYLQTIFRVQSPCSKNGQIKMNCYVFDFAPDRTLKMIADAASVSNKPGGAKETGEKKIKEFLNFCPVISFNGSEMKKYDTSRLLQQLKKVYADRALKAGFDDTSIYSDELYKLTNDNLHEFDNLKKIIGSTASSHNTKNIDINTQGFNEELFDEIEKLNIKKRKELTEEEQAKLDYWNEIKNNRAKAISILRGISVRMPLLIYGANIKFEDDFKIEDFLKRDIVDDSSWEEFMPAGVTKDLFKKFIKYYDKDVFIAAGRKIRSIAKYADSLEPTARIKKITELFSYFRNPDKETVLTPWRVVNLHLGKALGGYNFYDEQYNLPIEEPRFIDHGKITSKTFGSSSANILEINSKTGLYPLYATYSIYKQKLREFKENNNIEPSFEQLQELWIKTVKENIFVICKTEMAKKITKRTLVGFNDVKINAHYFENLINALSDSKSKLFIEKTLSKKYWKKGSVGKMDFNAVIGNPPYQVSSKDTSDSPVYHLFMNTAFTLSPVVSFITPARFLFNAGKTPKNWNQKILSDEHFKVVDYRSNSLDIFSNVDIKGGIAISLRDSSEAFGKVGNFIIWDELKSLLSKVESKTNSSFMDIIYSPESYKLTDALHKDFIDAESKLSKGHKYDIVTNIFEKLPEVFFNEKPQGDFIGILGRENNSRVTRWVKRQYICDHENLNYYKVILPKSNGTGSLGEALSSPIVVFPNIGHTQTFISVGKFESEIEAEACLKYIKTKFARCLLGILKVTQDNKKSVWKHIPMQDFTTRSDIDWSKTVKEVDQQLYDKYGLDDSEISFIEEHILEML